ncbi:MAG: hypothetical protein H6Q10_160 [Acidobacteria bacterium]|nr:hypothetical protein [Acidobacteriota bacterium]
MPDFTVRAESVNVEEIMGQIRARIGEKRGVDYTEEQIRELASVKLERFLDPGKVRSELLQQFREGGISPLPNEYSFDGNSLYESRRPWLAFIRRRLRPLLHLFINPNRLVQALQINARHEQYTNLAYEVLHNLVLETTRLGIEVKTLKMRVESLSSRLDFSERRARALEGVVMYRPGEGPEAEAAAAPAAAEAGRPPEGPGAAGEQRRKRRRRRGRRAPGAGAPAEEASRAGGDAPGEDGPEAAEPEGGAGKGEAGQAGAAPGEAEWSSDRPGSGNGSDES